MSQHSQLMRMQQLMCLMREETSDLFEIEPFEKNENADYAIYKHHVLFALVTCEYECLRFNKNNSRKIFGSGSPCVFYITVKDRSFEVIERKEKGCCQHNVSKTINVVSLLKSGKFIFDETSSKCDEIKRILEEKRLEDFWGSIKFKDGHCYFNEEDTDSFFYRLLSTKKRIQHVCRYTSLSSLFEMLRKKSYRLNGIVGMNDPTEIDYFEEYVGPNYFNYSYEEKNNIFISSCSTLIDDLTMWRLYGDQAKGVCIEFDVQGSDSRYIKNMVSYGNARGKDEHLDVVKRMMEMNFEFKGVEKWKHFFKPYEYRVEHEYRILFEKQIEANDENRKWVITNDNNILNPVYDISLQGKPMSMTNIILGPKCPEKNTNEKQIRALMKEQGITGINVYPSKIKNYR